MFELPDKGMERTCLVMGRAEIAQARVRIASQSFEDSGSDSRFSYTGLARQKDHLAFTFLRECPAAQQQLDLLLAPDEW